MSASKTSSAARVRPVDETFEAQPVQETALDGFNRGLFFHVSTFPRLVALTHGCMR